MKFKVAAAVVLWLLLAISLGPKAYHRLFDSDGSEKWEAITYNAPFSTRDGAGVVVFKGQTWVMGGWQDLKQGQVSDVWVTDNMRDWRRALASAPWGARHGFGLFEFLGRLWLIGGDHHADVWSSDNGVSWRRVVDSAPWGERYAPQFCKFKDRIWLLGGQKPIYRGGKISASALGYNDVWSSGDGIKWTRVIEHALWGPRGLIHGCAASDKEMFVVGGGLKYWLNGEARPRNLYEYNDVWSTSDGENWRYLGSAPWKKRTHLSVTYFDEKIWVSDGSVGDQSTLSNEVWFSRDGVQWKRVRNVSMPKRHASAFVHFKNQLYLMTGYLKNDIWVLTRDAKSSENFVQTE